MGNRILEGKSMIVFYESKDKLKEAAKIISLKDFVGIASDFQAAANSFSSATIYDPDNDGVGLTVQNAFKIASVNEAGMQLRGTTGHLELPFENVIKIEVYSDSVDFIFKNRLRVGLGISSIALRKALASNG
jgi:hypothetical protein